MKIYRVGGSVRDELLGRAHEDHDFVVVGATPESMVAAGYKPVGADFPVFLHPVTHAEYALARTERKVAPGYKGFTFHADAHVTLEEDLSRRDFTINAMAKDDAGNLIDPYGGARDLAAGVLRHVGPAFSEDPVRILRGARFAARFGFSLAPETLALMRAMVGNGEVDHLVAERVWQELARGLMEAHPARMFDVLRQAGALAMVLPELDCLWRVPLASRRHDSVDAGTHTLMVLEHAARVKATLSVRFACLAMYIGHSAIAPSTLPSHDDHTARSLDSIEALTSRLRVPSECRDLALLVAREHENIRAALSLTPALLHDVFARSDAFRRPQRFAEALIAGECDARARHGPGEGDYPQTRYLTTLRDAAQAVDAGAVAAAVQAQNSAAHAPREAIPKPDIAGAIRAARIEAIRNAAIHDAASH